MFVCDQDVRSRTRVQLHAAQREGRVRGGRGHQLHRIPSHPGEWDVLHKTFTYTGFKYQRQAAFRAY